MIRVELSGVLLIEICTSSTVNVRFCFPFHYVCQYAEREISLRPQCHTFFLTPSWTLESFRSTGGRNLEMMSCSCSSVSAWPNRRNTRSSWSKHTHTHTNVQHTLTCSKPLTHIVVTTEMICKSLNKTYRGGLLESSLEHCRM